MAINYDQEFQRCVDSVKKEGRYRVFATMERIAGGFRGPSTMRRTDRLKRSRSGAAMIIWAWGSIPPF